MYDLHNDSIERIEALHEEMKEEISCQVNDLRDEMNSLFKQNTEEIAGAINELSIVISKREKAEHNKIRQEIKNSNLHILK